MSAKTWRSTCPLNCWDQCSFLLTVTGGQVKSIKPDPAQKVTGNFICNKGKKLLHRLNHPARITRPLLKTESGFKPLSWAEAIAIMAEKISAALEHYGPAALLHYYDGGHGGVLKNIESRFFSALGGCTTHSGSLCWSAGLAAQTYDFGAVRAHSYEDLVHARFILIWGRNPAATAPHQLVFIRQARQKGARVVLIDPLKTGTAAHADEYISLKPGTDGALALGLAHLIIEEGLADIRFIEKHCSGFAEYRDLAGDFTPDRVSGITGIAPGVIENLARRYGAAKPAAILIGYGPQRHSNGGNTIRAIDALAALTGNIGVPGGGANYANFQVTPYIDQAYLEGADLSPAVRRYPKPLLADTLLEMQDPPVELIYVSRANPLTQAGNSRKLARAFNAVPFKVVSELFMTDTAAAADLVLPCTSFLEEEDIYFNSMGHTYLSYGPKVIDPPGECRHEHRVMQDLARKLKLRGYPRLSGDRLLSRIIRPLTGKKGITLEMLKAGPLPLPGGDAVPWRSGRFDTPGGKYNFYSGAAAAKGCDPLPVYREPVELGDTALREKGYRYWFVTPHPADSIHSGHRLPGGEGEPRACLHPETGAAEGLADGDTALITSPRGSLKARVRLKENIPPFAVMVHEGWWEATGANVNRLTPDRITDMGHQAALYDCLCRLEKIT